MSNEQKPGDPADKAADGAFGGIHSHRAGYGDDKLARLIDWVRQRPSATLASGEGALLLAEIDRQRAAAKDSADHYADARAEIDRLRDQLYLADQSARSSSAEADRLTRILAALREPSDEMAVTVFTATFIRHLVTKDVIRTAVAAAEQEVGRE